ncbi:MAG: helix-turn-helix domain-containing protein [Vicingaceae bacterium]|nr:helix-turn-helix domain-containing protein [Vicingaceae bacterium]
MSSNIETQRICQYCNNDFTARTTVTRYCSHKCASRAYKDRTRKKKVEKSISETKKVIARPVEVVKAKEFLTVRDVSILLGCSIRTAYRLIDSHTLKAVNLAERLTRVKRSELDKLLEQPKPKPEPKKNDFDISECYTITEVQQKFNISSGALYNLIKRNNVPKLSKGKFVYVPKTIIDTLMT